MRAMVLTKVAPLSQEPDPLRLVEMERPVPGDDELLFRSRFAGFATLSWMRSRGV